MDGFVADVVAGDRIFEIHTGSFWSLKTKLPRLLDRHPVTLVHPVAKDRYLVRAAPGNPARTVRRMSPKHGTVFEVFSALSSIPHLLEHPNLTLEVVLTVEEEIRSASNRRRRGWVCVDRRLVDVVRTYAIASMADLLALVDSDLPEEFTTSDIARAMSSRRRLGQQAAYCFRRAGVARAVGKRGNEVVYRRVAGSTGSEMVGRAGAVRH